MKTITPLVLVAFISGTAFAAHAETGRYGRSPIYDVGNPGYHGELSSGCMDMPCCKNMKSMQDCMDMPCCKDMKMSDDACMKMMGKGHGK